MSIRKKLYAVFGVSIALTVIMATLALWVVHSLGSAITDLTNVSARQLYLAGDINTITSDMVAEERGMIARGLIKDLTTVNQYSREFDQSLDRLKKRSDEFRTLVSEGESRRILTEVQASYGQLESNHAGLLRIIQAGDMSGAAEHAKNVSMPLLVRISAAGERLAQAQLQSMSTDAGVATARVSRCLWTIAALLVLTALAAAGIVLVVRGVNTHLETAMVNLEHTAHQLASAAAQVSSASQSLAQGASEQAASIEETSASSEEINSMAHKNSSHARSASDALNVAQQNFTKANQALQDTVDAMDAINQQSGQISKIIKTIDEISFQTNILALNAAVEAARAGEAGMGFAVVADEVRSLAQRCAQAARDTAQMIEESIVKSNDGKHKVDRAAVAIKAVSEQTGKVKELVDEVTLGGQEEVRGIEQISKAIAQIEHVTQQAAANSEQSAAAAQELTSQSEALRGIVDNLASMVGASASADRLTGQADRDRPAARMAAASLGALRSAVERHGVGRIPEAPAPRRKSKDEALPLETEFADF